MMVKEKQRGDKTLRILITAPDRDLLDSLQNLLALCGWEADVAHDGVMAVEKSRAAAYDAALVDAKIPLIRAVDLTEELEASGTPAILMTEDEASGGKRVLKYPFAPEKLLAAIESAVGGKGEAKDE